MSFYFAYGSYATLPCSARASSNELLPVQYNNFTVAFQRRITIDFWLYVTNTGINRTTNLTAEQIAFENAIAIPNQSGGLMYLDGMTPSTTRHWLSSVGAIGGVQVEGVRWLDSPTHLVTELKGQITLSAIYANPSETATTLALEESLDITGEGGADTPLAPQYGAPSIRQQVADYTDVTVVQSGLIVGRNGYPSFPMPVIATSGARQVKLTRDSMMPVQVRNGILFYRRQYSMTFTLPAHPGPIVPNVLT